MRAVTLQVGIARDIRWCDQCGHNTLCTVPVLALIESPPAVAEVAEITLCAECTPREEIQRAARAANRRAIRAFLEQEGWHGA